MADSQPDNVALTDSGHSKSVTLFPYSSYLATVGVLILWAVKILVQAVTKSLLTWLNM